MSSEKKITSVKVWDKEAQTFHGGQDWIFVKNLIEDMSITTNGLGYPKKAYESAVDSLKLISHYPSADFEPTITDVAKFFWGKDFHKYRTKLLLGNGASELIDLVIRDAPKGDFVPGPSDVQYKEYERSALSNERKILPKNSKNASVMSIVNPNNPTGDYMNIDKLKKYIEKNSKNGSYVVVDESMQMWIGEKWRDDSLIMQHEWISKMEKERQVCVFVIHSFTKIWNCAGIRLGSIICPSASYTKRLKKRQIPWSVNCVGLKFLSSCCEDEDFLKETWEKTPKWREYMVNQIKEKHPFWKVYGEPFLSWLWIDVLDEEMCEKAVELSRKFGVPVRSGKYGYELPTFVRVAVRKKELADILMSAWEPLEKTKSCKEKKL
jgi:histidinol-phosphate/aromatic aminotransferase/cobyric acid decarboxylase-like protein